MKLSAQTRFLQAQLNAIRSHFSALRDIYLENPSRDPAYLAKGQAELNRLMAQQKAMEAPVQTLLSASLRSDLTRCAA